MRNDWGGLLTGQLEFYWNTHLRPRLEGLTDEEYFWEPVEGCWTLRAGEFGVYRLDGHQPEPSPAPVTTIAWRLIHVATGMSTRVSTFFDVDTETDVADMFDPRHRRDELPGTAAAGVQFLDESYHRWRDAITALDEAGLSRPLGPKGGFFAEEPMAALIVHVNREVMHHGGELCLLRDLYRAGITARSRCGDGL
jgi:hypothetical protein